MRTIKKLIENLSPTLEGLEFFCNEIERTSELLGLLDHFKKLTQLTHFHALSSIFFISELFRGLPPSLTHFFYPQWIDRSLFDVVLQTKIRNLDKVLFRTFKGVSELLSSSLNPAFSIETFLLYYNQDSGLNSEAIAILPQLGIKNLVMTDVYGQWKEEYPISKAFFSNLSNTIVSLDLESSILTPATENALIESIQDWKHFTSFTLSYAPRISSLEKLIEALPNSLETLNFDSPMTPGTWSALVKKLPALTRLRQFKIGKISLKTLIESGLVENLPRSLGSLDLSGISLDRKEMHTLKRHIKIKSGHVKKVLFREFDRLFTSEFRDAPNPDLYTD